MCRPEDSGRDDHSASAVCFRSGRACGWHAPGGELRTPSSGGPAARAPRTGPRPLGRLPGRRRARAGRSSARASLRGAADPGPGRRPRASARGVDRARRSGGGGSHPSRRRARLGGAQRGARGRAGPGAGRHPQRARDAATGWRRACAAGVGTPGPGRGARLRRGGAHLRPRRARARRAPPRPTFLPRPLPRPLAGLRRQRPAAGGGSHACGGGGDRPELGPGLASRAGALAGRARQPGPCPRSAADVPSRGRLAGARARRRGRGTAAGEPGARRTGAGRR